MLSYSGQFKSTKFVVLNSLPMVYCKKSLFGVNRKTFSRKTNTFVTLKKIDVNKTLSSDSDICQRENRRERVGG